MRASPTGSSGESPQTMVPPPNPFAMAQPVARNPSLAAPSLPSLGSRSPVYSSHSYHHSVSPSTASGSLPELQNHDAPSLIISPTQISSANLNAQKRAYRQRRKDPSCDACRERKVKCDATDTSACSECSSRNHRCQFTKETNRRMSSIKQVQDLQSQIAELTQVNSQLRTKVTDRDPLEYERTDMKRRHSDLNTGGISGPRRVSVPVLNNFDHVRSNIRKHSQGIFSTPRQKTSVPAEMSWKLPDLPPRAEFAHLSHTYLHTIHTSYPALHWPTFQHEVDRMYASGSFEGCSRVWIGLFFAVLACGTLQPGTDPSYHPNARSRGSRLFETASLALQPWSLDLSFTHAQAALVLSIFAAEDNMRSVGSMWLAAAVRAVQELQICRETDYLPPFEGEKRRRLWWSIYVRDRITSLDTSRPMLINEHDCEMSLPSPLDDRYIQPNDAFRSEPNLTHSTGFVAMIQITRLYASLYQVLKSTVILPPDLRTFDEQFRWKSQLLPESYHISSCAPLDAIELPTVFALLSARFHFHRCNLSSAADPAERAEALDRCTSIAQETAKYVSRALHSPSRHESERTWRERVAPVASNAVCLHLWRCILMLCFRGDYEAAQMCLHLSSAIGSIRKINTACGRNAAFVLEELLDRIHGGHGGAQQLEHDEEMIAYISADAQGSFEHSWVWTGADMNSSTAAETTSPSAHRPSGIDEPMRDALPLRTVSGSPHDGISERDDWTRVGHIVRQLMDEYRRRTGQQPTYYPPPHNPVKRVQLAPETRSPPKPTAAPASSSASRISIANII